MNKNDYLKILLFYKKTIPKNNTQIKIEAEKILSEKLCRCIKKLDPVNEARSIGICTKTIFNNKGFKRGDFSCKKKQHVTFSKSRNKRNKNNKTRKERK
jgi:hypothetical protein